jgi:uncharacterized membrane protein YkoI
VLRWHDTRAANGSEIWQEHTHMNRSIKSTLVPAVLFAAAAFAPLAAQDPQPPYKRDLPAALRQQATVAEADAAKTAMAKIPNGRIQAVELENEGGHLLYSYELKVRGHSGIEEVNVDAKTGEVVNTEHEGAKAEQTEARDEKAQHARGGKPNKGGAVPEEGEGSVG